MKARKDGVSEKGTGGEGLGILCIYMCVYVCKVCTYSVGIYICMYVMYVCRIFCSFLFRHVA